VVWPIDGSLEPQRLSSTFGPRLQAGASFAYDFHRGIDIPAPEGTSVYAISAGEVTKAGDDPGYSDKIVQIEHCDGDGGCTYSNYIHLSEASVEVGEQVDAGDEIGLSGVAESGFPHLHFEIRDGGKGQERCVHPLRTLPGLGWAPPQISSIVIDDADPAAVTVEVTVGALGVDPALVRVEIATSDRATGAAIEERVFDFEEWNRKYTLPDDPGAIDDPDLEGIHVDPAEFNEDSVAYGLRLRFGGLMGAARPGDLMVTARAIDVRGEQGVATGP
jgi:murein DD-endopeptidase MepM/ murein hydrolase activator NlpD